MQRIVLKCDGCDTTVIDDTLDGGSTLVMRKVKAKKGRTKYPNIEWIGTWHFCEPCTLKQRKRLTKKLGDPSEGDDDDY
jgi:hypothetical protein